MLGKMLHDRVGMSINKNNAFEVVTKHHWSNGCLLYTSDAADERSSVDLGGRRIIKKKKKKQNYTNRETLHKASSR